MTAVPTPLSDALARLPDYLGGHLLLSLSALAFGLAISLPLGLVASRRPALRRIALAAASVVQTIPGLALLTLFYPILLGLAAISKSILGVEFSALGFLPALLALALYTMLPVLRNVVTGFAAIDEGAREAARALGLTRRQILWLVEWPLALPVAMAGVRTAAVWVVGTATLSTPIGQPSLGNYIFAGLQTQNWVFVLFGCIMSALLALAIDGLLALIQSGISDRRRPRLLAGIAGLCALGAVAAAPVFARPAAQYVIGAKTFTEQYVLAALIGQRLNEAGLPATQREGLGSAVILDALAHNNIDVYVDYSGTIWANAMKRGDVAPREQMLAEIQTWLLRERGVTLLGALGFENAYALAMSRTKAQALGIGNISDLARQSAGLTIAGDYEFFARPEWTALKQTYRLAFKAQRQMQPEFMYPAAADNQVDVIAAFSSEGLIARHDLVVLADDRHSLPAYDAILLASPRRADDARMIAALKPLIGRIDLAIMQAANSRASSGGADASPDSVATWLWDQIRTK